MEDFETLLKGSAEAHGHLCAGQVVGVRMAMLGCRLIGLDNPRSLEQIKKIIIYVEIDRCATDAISFVTGVKLGRRSLKFKDYGIMAATFINLETKKAFRVLSTEASRDLAPQYAPGVSGKTMQQLEGYKKMPDDVLFRVQEVDVAVGEFDYPGPTKAKVTCSRCGQVVRDHKEVTENGEVLCKPCSVESYFQNPREVDISGDLAYHEESQC